MICRAAIIVASLLLATAGSAIADGLSTAPYRYVNPPQFLKNTNLPPQATSQVIGLRQPNPFVFTPDAQAALSSSARLFGHPSGQTGARISIAPLRSFPALPSTSIQIPGTNQQSALTLDGNVYGFNATYVPSKRPVVVAKPLLITLEYPHTPYEMVALQGKTWKVICTQTTLTLTPSTAACNEKAVAPAAALLYLPFQGKGFKPTSTPAAKSGLPWLVIVPSLIAIILLVFLIGGPVLSRRRRAPS